MSISKPFLAAARVKGRLDPLPKKADNTKPDLMPRPIEKLSGSIVVAVMKNTAQS